MARQLARRPVALDAVAETLSPGFAVNGTGFQRRTGPFVSGRTARPQERSQGTLPTFVRDLHGGRGCRAVVSAIHFEWNSENHGGGPHSIHPFPPPSLVFYAAGQTEPSRVRVPQVLLTPPRPTTKPEIALATSGPRAGLCWSCCVGCGTASQSTHRYRYSVRLLLGECVNVDAMCPRRT